MPVIINNCNVSFAGSINVNPSPVVSEGPPYLTGYWRQTTSFPNSFSPTASVTISPMYSNVAKSGQLRFGEIYYSDPGLTTPITASTLNMSAFSVTQGGTVYKSFRLSSTNGPIGLMNAIGTLNLAVGYMVKSDTKINVGNTTQAWGFEGDTDFPLFVGGFLYSDSNKSWQGGNWAWAATPNTVATHLIAVDGTSGWPIITSIS